MSLATYLRDRLPSAFVRAAALGLVVLALAAYGVESGVLAFVTVAFLAGAVSYTHLSLATSPLTTHPASPKALPTGRAPRTAPARPPPTLSLIHI